MPGGGYKYSFVSGENPIPINDLVVSNSLLYVQIVKPDKENLDVLHDRDNYFLLLDSDTIRYEPTSDKFYFKDEETSPGGAYKRDGVKVIRL